LALPEHSLWGPSPVELTIIFCCLISDSPNLESYVPVYISHRNKVAQLYPRALVNYLLNFEVEVTLRPTVSRPVSLGVRPPSGTSDQFFFHLEIFFRQLRVCYFVAPSLTRRRVCNLLLLLFLASILINFTQNCMEYPHLKVKSIHR
jgi:hypothetical protein